MRLKRINGIFFEWAKIYPLFLAHSFFAAMDYEKRLEKARKFADIFEVVKDMVMEFLGTEQAGLLVGLSDLGAFDRGFVGAFYAPDANTIIINKRPLNRLLNTNPGLFNFYLFHVMLHEYLHSLGLYDEAQTRTLVQEISRHYFGDSHAVTQLSTNMERFMPNLIYPHGNEIPEDISIDFVEGIDRKNTGYIN